MKREDVYNATVMQVNREILPVNMSLDRQINEMQIEQTIPCSKRQSVIFEVILYLTPVMYSLLASEIQLERMYQKQSTK